MKPLQRAPLPVPRTLVTDLQTGLACSYGTPTPPPASAPAAAGAARRWITR